eukprot:CAMPEP_0113440336 /NCGR_PEP_ID=MMETSP0014_2-20120614/505_1 /TAXON_ID=2857 /ORGANISM="Nitzschia sp." /LENGTH=455 /DNA_ID=CAMNT_0000331127 /DNA_START=193 /DNA_END=1560 /DNA_ORIENTATION=- /assembly_acc=CAM_ASM_000159
MVLLLSLALSQPHTTVVEGWSMFQSGSSRVTRNRDQSRSRHHNYHLSKNKGRLTRTLQFLSPQSLLTKRLQQSDASASMFTTTSRSSNNSSDDSNIVESMKILKTENSLLRETIRELQQENQQLITKTQHQQQQSSSLAGSSSSAGAGGVPSPPPPKIVLETFEGERYIRQQQQDNSNINNKNNGVEEFGAAPPTPPSTTMTETVGLVGSPREAASAPPPPGMTMSVEEQQLPSLSSSSSSQDINIIDNNELWCDDVLEDGSCPLEPAISFGEALRDRAYWLVGLLVMQSLSGIILASNEALLANHPEIIYYLTMMVGAGGNAGNQASVRVIRGLALGTLNDKTRNQFLTRELKMAASLSIILSIAGFFRAIAFRTAFPEAITVTSALFLIVFTSICLGAVLPLLLERIGVDPAHSSTTIQVIMDIGGVFLAVLVSKAILDGPLGVYVLSKLGYL